MKTFFTYSSSMVSANCCDKTREIYTFEDWWIFFLIKLFYWLNVGSRMFMFWMEMALSWLFVLQLRSLHQTLGADGTLSHLSLYTSPSLPNISLGLPANTHITVSHCLNVLNLHILCFYLVVLVLQIMRFFSYSNISIRFFCRAEKLGIPVFSKGFSRPMPTPIILTSV